MSSSEIHRRRSDRRRTSNYRMDWTDNDDDDDDGGEEEEEEDSPPFFHQRRKSPKRRVLTEQIEFARKYSRDLRSRRRKEQRQSDGGGEGNGKKMNFLEKSISRPRRTRSYEYRHKEQVENDLEGSEKEQEEEEGGGGEEENDDDGGTKRKYRMKRPLDKESEEEGIPEGHGKGTRKKRLLMEKEGNQDEEGEEENGSRKSESFRSKRIIIDKETIKDEVEDEDKGSRKSGFRSKRLLTEKEIRNEQNDKEQGEEEEEEGEGGDENERKNLKKPEFRSKRSLIDKENENGTFVSKECLLRRSSRRRVEDRNVANVAEIEEEEEEEEERCSLRRSSRSRKGQRYHGSSEERENVRRKRKTESDEEDEDDESGVENGNNVVSVRPRRSRLPVDRLTYSNTRTSNPRSSGEIRNLDQYSSDDEFKGSPSSTRRCRKYNMRENRTRTNRYTLDTNKRNNLKINRVRFKPSATNAKKSKLLADDVDDNSSSSSDISADESRFEKRKAKRMSIEKAKMIPLNMNKRDVTMSIFRERQKIGTSLADVSPMEMDMGVTFDSVGGCIDHINSLKEMVMFPLLYPELFSKFGINPPRGVLFYGPPGTGKTLIARALACETSKEGKKVAFFMRKGADCLSKWIGESERQLRLLFDQAFLMRPSIIFFDEIDGLAPIRSSRQDQIHSSIVSTLLALMDGLDNRGEIIVIGATNRIDSIDPALRRPGRFDRELRFSLPTRDARREILSLHVKTWQPPLEPEVLDVLSEKTIGYSGADLKGLCGESALNALRRRYPQVYKSTEKLALDVNKVTVGMDDFLKAMKTMIPSTHRVSDQFQSPLPSHIRPLLQGTYLRICQEIDRIFLGDDVFRPRLLICGDGSGHGQTTYLGPAILHHLERLPAQKLDIPTLYSNSARSPEESLSQIVHEAKRTLPGILYIPHIAKLWRTVSDTVQKTFVSMLSDIQPTAPLLILAISEESCEVLPEELSNLFVRANKEVFTLDVPNEMERMEFFNPIFTAALVSVPVEDDEEEEEEEVLPLASTSHRRRLTEREEKRLRKKEDCRLRELRIFLRDVHAKINREQKFFMFRSAVDTEEVFDYLDLIKEPMDFDAMLVKLDEGKYKCAQDFLDDIDLIADNAVTYNSDLNYETNKIICHRAASLRDFAYALVKQEMDTDFEEECKEIAERRKKLSEELAKEQEEEEKILPVSSPVTKKTKKIKKCLKKKSELEGETHEEENNDLITTGIRIDTAKWQERKTDLIRATKGFSVERSERVFVKCMSLVKKYATQTDRTQLPTDLQVFIDQLKNRQR